MNFLISPLRSGRQIPCSHLADEASKAWIRQPCPSAHVAPGCSLCIFLQPGMGQTPLQGVPILPGPHCRSRSQTVCEPPFLSLQIITTPKPPSSSVAQVTRAPLEAWHKQWSCICGAPLDVPPLPATQPSSALALPDADSLYCTGVAWSRIWKMKGHFIIFSKMG